MLTLFLVVFGALWTALPSGAVAHDAYSNGCGPHNKVGSYIPDVPLGIYNFHAACDFHDRCYGLRPYGSTPAARARCDSEFKGKMLVVCYTEWLNFGKFFDGCVFVAQKYYEAVRNFGRF